MIDKRRRTQIAAEERRMIDAKRKEKEKWTSSEETTCLYTSRKRRIKRCRTFCSKRVDQISWSDAWSESRKEHFFHQNEDYLLRWNIKTKKSSNKLNHMKLKSFKILEEKKLINYELNLSTFMKIHSVFHIFLLKSADLNLSIQTESSEIDSKSQNIKYEVENILNQQNIKDQSH